MCVYIILLYIYIYIHTYIHTYICICSVHRHTIAATVRLAALRLVLFRSSDAYERNAMNCDILMLLLVLATVLTLDASRVDKMCRDIAIGYLRVVFRMHLRQTKTSHAVAATFRPKWQSPCFLTRDS